MVIAQEAGLSVTQVADYFMRRVDTDAGDCMTNLRLQKLVYYAQAWHLAITGRPLFAEEFQAWIHGPVVPELYSTYSTYTLSPLPRPDGPFPSLDGETESVLDEVWNVYGQFTAKHLEDMTHNEPPWVDAREGYSPGEACQEIISKEAMRAYYASQLK